MQGALRRAVTVGMTFGIVAATVNGLAPTAVAGQADDPPGEASVQMGKGRVEARGAAVRLPTNFRCPAGHQAFLSAQVVQAIGRKFAGGFDGTERACTGEEQKVTFYLQAVPGENTRPFRPGSASARVFLDAVDPESFSPFAAEAPEAAPVPAAEPAEQAPAALPLPLPAADTSGSDEPEPDEVEPEDIEPVPAPVPVRAEDRGTIRLRGR